MGHGAHELVPAVPIFHTDTGHTFDAEGAVEVAFRGFILGFQWLTTSGSPGDIQGIIGCQVCDQAGQPGNLVEEDVHKGGGDGEG